ncbi:MAG: hypothetical protein V3S11_06500 [Elusimicrobiota bacterium]
MRTFSTLMVLFIAAAPAFAGTDTVRLPSDEALDPVSRSDRPWVVAHSPDAKQLVETFRLLGESADQAGEAYVELTRSAAEAESGFVSSSVPSPGFRAEGPLKDAIAEKKTDAAPGTSDRLITLERTLAAESRRLDRLGSSMEALLRLDRAALAKRRVRRAIVRLDKRVRALRGAYASLRDGIDLLGLSASWHGEKIGTAELSRALRLQNAARSLDWKIERLGMSVRSLRRRAR